MAGRPLLVYAPVAGLLLVLVAPGHAAAPALPGWFVESGTCVSCHNGLTGPGGEDLSIGFDQGASMMANSARDPYWQAGIRREILDHPAAAAAIQEECSTCHMPMAHHVSLAMGQPAEVFAHLPVTPGAPGLAGLAADGVSCGTCHQVLPDNLGTEDSFVGGILVDQAAPAGQRAAFGPYAVDAGRTRVMASATGFVPTQAEHLGSAELCATCHTLITHALGPGGEVVGRLPEQVPYQEWQQSVYAASTPCQSCHMPPVGDEVDITSVLGQPREGMNPHVFRGGNFLIPGLLNRHRGELGVVAQPQDLDAAIVRTRDHLQERSARVTVSGEIQEGRLVAEVRVENLAGHKLPTAYPSRRAWLHVTVRDATGALVFESGALDARGAIAGNDNDLDPASYEPHHAEITAPDQVQIYEPILVDTAGAVTTGLLRAVAYGKDNRLLPLGFEKEGAPDDVAVRGGALGDPDFGAGSDGVRYVVDVGAAPGPFRVTAALRYQPIGFRWAENLRGLGAMETDRFVGWYETLGTRTAMELAADVVEVPAAPQARPDPG